MTQAILCFIGAGNMAGSMIGGLVTSDYAADRIIACDINQPRLDQLQADFGIQTQTDINQAVSQADIVILAVKPQVMQSVCRTITQTQHKPLFISVAAGLRETDINRWLGGALPMVRCMPNTPALVAQGASGLFANSLVSDVQKQQAESILQSTGITVWVDTEDQLNAVTAISGSGPAYFFLFIEALENAAIELGLDKETAASLARQTALGAATMAIGKNVVELRQQVTSPGGTTEQAISSFLANDLQSIVSQATQAAHQRSIELAEQLAQ